MRSLPASALLLISLLPAAYAQHGGGAHSGNGGAHAAGGGSHSAQGPVYGLGHLPVGPGRPAFGIGQLPVGPGRAAFGPGPVFGSALNRNPYAARGPRSVAHSGYASAFFSAHQGYGFSGGTGTYSSGLGRYGGSHSPLRRSGVGLNFFYGAGYPAFVDFGYLNPYWNYADLASDDQIADASQANSGVYAQNPYTTEGYPQANDPANPYAAQAAPSYNGGYPEPQQQLQQPNEADQPLVYAPYAYADPDPYGPPQQPRVTVVTVPQPLREEDAVTLFFRDGRPPEQIRNYALTRTSLLITSPRLREIPLTDLDLPLTEQVNHAAGVEFRLPQAR